MDEAERTQILELLANGESSAEIARRLGVPKMRVANVKAQVTRGILDALPAEGDDPGTVTNLKFGLERDMQDALRRNIQQLDPGLKIVDDGNERHVEGGFIDILAEDGDGALVVIELKAGEAPDSVVAQVLSYVASLQATESGRRVRALLVAREFPTRVRLAARAAGIQLVSYGYDFNFAVVEAG
jgi:hypothetical protein